ncbi:uncharacterized protein LOC132200088 isoform X1 [Neocloeon triangulifer]|uniref:uncharacterized protein LOC132200088 isoform X1 n=1 Tax=Neocloeon triangulifer TaxID=2078957 RepID=UPI00286F650C|nr:uncharacterized protein LOC132200088 isoform X1 [Neocloeon triangulifer]
MGQTERIVAVVVLVSVIIILASITLPNSKVPDASKVIQAELKIKKASSVSLSTLRGLPFDDERLLSYTMGIIRPPVDRSVPYVLKEMTKYDYSWQVIAPTVLKFLKNRTNGFFVDCGAHDGELYSNTLTLEKYFNWMGLLVEASPKELMSLTTKNRKSWIAPTCMSLSKTPDIVSFHENSLLGKVIGPKEKVVKTDTKVKYVDILCLPFNTLLTSLNRTKIDFFSLDVEGREFEILQTIDFKKFEFDILVVEYPHNGPNIKLMAPFMDRNGYSLLHTSPMDFYFLNKKLKL